MAASVVSDVFWFQRLKKGALGNPEIMTRNIIPINPF